MIALDNKEANKFLKDNGVAEKFLAFKIQKQNEGVLEGLLRETVHTLIKNNTIANHLVLIRN